MKTSKYIGSIILILITNCGTDEPSMIFNYEEEHPCCKVCENSKPCGDSCIPKNRQCFRPKGCACTYDESTEKHNSFIKINQHI